MNSIVRVGDGDVLYGEQWKLSGDRRVSIVLRDLNPRLQAVLFYRLIPSVFHKTDQQINIKKATGVDQISCKLLKAGAPVLNKHLTTLLNNTIKHSQFPNRLKEAQVVPLHKKNDPLDKENYRPVSILPTISKIYEMMLSDQLVESFNNIFHDCLCAFRKGHGCQTTLLRPLEDWKSDLDKNCYVAAILMDLSKAFDCLPHSILLSKLTAYGLSSQSIKLLENYLTGNTSNFRGWSVVDKFYKKVFPKVP
jgi:hypothetical protein